MTPTVGERLGPYEILDRLGRGGMGLVYRGWDGRLCREVAIKLLDPESCGVGSRERFLQEARTASALNHPNICTIFDIGEKDGTPYLVMELLEGETLKERIERGGLPVEVIVQYGVEIAEALGAAHARGMVHRDIKPANIVLVARPDGGRMAKVLDFGLAKMDGRKEEREGHEGCAKDAVEANGGEPDGAAVGIVRTTVGTVAYMSPEQARGEALDGRSDLFSLGVVMYEMATQRMPFGANEETEAGEEFERIREWNDAVPRSLEKVVLRLLEKDRAARFQTAAEVVAALKALAEKHGGWLRRLMPLLVPMSEPVAKQGRRMEAVREGGAESGRRVISQEDEAGVLRPMALERELGSVAIVFPGREKRVERPVEEGDPQVPRRLA